MTVTEQIERRAQEDDAAINRTLMNLEGSNNESIELINNKNKILLEKSRIQDSQLKALTDKEKILLTRSRMLQVAQDRNSFRTKIIYTLVAIIFVICILTLFLYSMKSKK